MLVARTRLGHRDDPEVAARLDGGDAHRVVLSDTERKRSRVRTEAADGTDVGVVVAADLGDGDVLETDGGALVVVELDAVDALVLDLDGADVSPLDGVRLGHALGNRHWDLAVRDGAALFPVPDTRERMREQVRDHLPDGVEPRFETVPPTTFDDGDRGHARGHHHGESGHAEHAHGGHAHGQGDHTHDHSEHAHGADGHAGGHDAHTDGALTVDREDGETEEEDG